MNTTRGFTLLEIALALLVLAVLTAALTPSITGSIRHRQVEAEQRVLSELADAITRSFESDDFDENLAAMPGTIGWNDHWTEFSVTTGLPYFTGSPGHWPSKLSRLNGRPPWDIATNASRNGRHLFAAPSEPERQRFVLFSLVAAPGELALPEYTANPDWVDQIWRHNWEKADSLPPAEIARWMQGRAGTTQVYRFCVRRIILPKYTVTVNNTHPTDSVFVSFDHQENAFVVPPGAGSQTSRGIFAGRLITVRQGVESPDTVTLRFPLTRNATVTLQPPVPQSDGTVTLQ
ncbi:hypothetical protein OPIT5_22105 [Opitutaceae bacterium TAV5]|nr:hypothetical protein OPIT5_22105 [Opitutaceae bacterium TAV5]